MYESNYGIGIGWSSIVKRKRAFQCASKGERARLLPSPGLPGCEPGERDSKFTNSGVLLYIRTPKKTCIFSQKFLSERFLESLARKPPNIVDNFSFDRVLFCHDVVAVYVTKYVPRIEPSGEIVVDLVIESLHLNFSDIVSDGSLLLLLSLSRVGSLATVGQIDRLWCHDYAMNCVSFTNSKSSSFIHRFCLLFFPFFLHLVLPVFTVIFRFFSRRVFFFPTVKNYRGSESVTKNGKQSKQ